MCGPHDNTNVTHMALGGPSVWHALCRPNWTGLYGNVSKNISWPTRNKVTRVTPTQPQKAELFCWSGILHFCCGRKYIPYKCLSTDYILRQLNSVYTLNYIPQKRVLVLFSHVQLSQKRALSLRFWNDASSWVSCCLQCTLHVPPTIISLAYPF